MSDTNWDEYYNKCNNHVRYCLTIFTSVTFIICGFVLSIFDIVIGVNWKDCYLNQKNVNIYLVISGSLMFTSLMLLPKIIQNNETNNSSMLGQFATLCGLAYFGNLIWGMTIVWGTNQNNCNIYQYNYLYYRTIVICFLSVCFIVIHANKNKNNNNYQPINSLSIEHVNIDDDDDELETDV